MESTSAPGPAGTPATTAADPAPATPRPAPGPAPTARPAAAPDPAGLRLRRAPKYRAFMLTGVVLGVLVALLVVALAPDSGDGNGRSVLGYLAVSLGAFGALLGGATALLVERRRPRR